MTAREVTHIRLAYTDGTQRVLILADNPIQRLWLCNAGNDPVIDITFPEHNHPEITVKDVQA